MPRISAVIGFQNWGANRIRMAGESILRSLALCDGELIISDYGSDSPEEVREIAHDLGAKYVYTRNVPVWSRSAALNAGFSVAEGDLLVSTDADMLFSIESFPAIAEYAERIPNGAFFLQCRDLPEGYTDAFIDQLKPTWDDLESVARLRPRWGMGGMMAIPRAGMEAIRGFDERLHTYGGEDLDFAKRAARAGYRMVWIDDPRVRMYHMWHPSSKNAALKTPAGQAAVAFNRSVVYHDESRIRNTTSWRFPLKDVPPLVSVAIVTFNRAKLLRETIKSVLIQTVQDFEIIIVDDGSTDHTRQVVEEFSDPRIHYIWQENSGISAARNRALDHSRGLYTAVIDDDDLMHPQRLEWQLSALNGEHVGSVGAFMNFFESDGDVQLAIGRCPSKLASVLGGAPGHGTWLISTDILRKFRYDETLTSGVDHNLMLRMAHSGVNIIHTGKPVTLRRMHDAQVTSTDEQNQSNSAQQSTQFYTFNLSTPSLDALTNMAEKPGNYPDVTSKDDLLQEFIAYLPDKLVKRRLILKELTTSSDDIDLDGTLKGSLVYRSDGSIEFYGIVESATYDDMVRLRQANIPFEAQHVPTNKTEPCRANDQLSVRWQILHNEAHRLLTDSFDSDDYGFVLFCSTNEDVLEETTEGLVINFADTMGQESYVLYPVEDRNEVSTLINELSSLRLVLAGRNERALA